MMKVNVRKLVIIRGNSGSGKTVIANAVRDKSKNKRNVAVLSQDDIRRKILKEHDEPHARNILVIRDLVILCLRHGFDVILEGILTEDRYGDMLKSLINEEKVSSYVYYLDIPLEETIQRHETKPNSHEFGEKELRRWYREKDTLGVDNEQIIDQYSSLNKTVDRIIDETSI